MILIVIIRTILNYYKNCIKSYISLNYFYINYNIVTFTSRRYIALLAYLPKF